MKAEGKRSVPQAFTPISPPPSPGTLGRLSRPSPTPELLGAAGNGDRSQAGAALWPHGPRPALHPRPVPLRCRRAPASLSMVLKARGRNSGPRDRCSKIRPQPRTTDCSAHSAARQTRRCGMEYGKRCLLPLPRTLSSDPPGKPVGFAAAFLPLNPVTPRDTG